MMTGVDGNGPKRFSVQRKMAIVARLLRGEPLELVARETNVSIARLTGFLERALAGAASALKERERDDRDDEIARLKSKVGGTPSKSCEPHSSSSPLATTKLGLSLGTAIVPQLSR